MPIGVGPTADKVLILTWGVAHIRPDPVLLALVQRFADHAGAALALAARRDLEAEPGVSTSVSKSSLMPAQTISHPAIAVASRYQSGARGLRIGGDFVGVAQLADGRVAVVVGDVSGHGPDAAALGSDAARQLARSGARRCRLADDARDSRRSADSRAARRRRLRDPVRRDHRRRRPVGGSRQRCSSAAIADRRRCR